MHCRIARCGAGQRLPGNPRPRVLRVASSAVVHRDKETSLSEETRSLTSQETPPVDPPPAPASSPTVTHYQQVAVQLIGALDSFSVSIPDFQNPSITSKDFVRKKRHIPARFVTAAVGSLQLSPELLAVKQLSPESSQDDAQFIEALTPVLMQLGVVFKGLQSTIDARKARLAAGAQKIYAVAKGLAQDADGTAVAAHVENMRRALKRPRSAKSKQQPAPAPAPTPSPVPAPHAAGEGTGGGVTQK